MTELAAVVGFVVAVGGFVVVDCVAVVVVVDIVGFVLAGARWFSVVQEPRFLDWIQ